MMRKSVYISVALSVILVVSIVSGILPVQAQFHSLQTNISDDRLAPITNSSFYIGSRDFMADSVIGPDDSVYAVGSYLHTFSWDMRMVVAKWDSGGNLVWGTTWNQTRVTTGYGIYLTNDGLYVIGSTQYDILIAKLSFEGIVLWNKTIDTGMREDGLEIVVDSDENIYIYGYREGLIDTIWFVEKFIAKIGQDGVRCIDT